MVAFRLSLFLLLLLASFAPADEIILKDGSRIYGEVTREGDHVVVVDGFGKSVVLKDEVNEIKDLETLRKEYEHILSREPENPPHFRLACWCWKRGLREEARAHFEAVLEKAPENRGARWALGQYKVEGIWVQAGVWTRLPDKKKTWVRFVPEGVKGRLQVRMGEEPNEARDLIRRLCFGKPEERDAAGKKLAALAGADRKEGYRLALLDGASRIRCFASEQLASMPGQDVEKSLLKSSLYDASGKVREAALKSLVEGPFPRARDLVIEGLNSKHFHVRLNAIDALPSFPAKESVEALCMMMESNDVRYGGSPRVNISIGRQFGYIRDFDVEVAQWTEIGDPIIATQMEGVVLDVRVIHVVERQATVAWHRAHRALREIAGKDLGQDVEVWRNWARKHFDS